MKINTIAILFVFQAIFAFMACNTDSTQNEADSKNPTLPTLVTVPASSVTYSTALTGGEIASNGGSDISARGVCWNTEEYPTITNNHTSDGTGNGRFTSTISGLEQNTKYYVRAYATNSLGTKYGNEQTFVTEEDTRTVTDADGNVYATVKIGTQLWMAENLRTTTLNDGTAMTNLADATQWWQQSVSTTTCAYCSYGNNDNNATTYGRLYNWNAVYSGKLSPKNWHIPTEVDWKILENYLIQNGYNYDSTTTENKFGQAIASTGNWTFWNVIGTVGNNQTNRSGFNAYPAGYRDDNGIFKAFGTHAFFWSMPGSADANSKYAYYHLLSYKSISFSVSSGPEGYCGFSVRCVKD